MSSITQHDVENAFLVIRRDGLPAGNIPSTKWDIIDPKTGERFAPKAVLRIARELAGDETSLPGGGPGTNTPLANLGFEIVLKPHLEVSDAATDIQEVLASEADETTKQRLVNARLGQGGFRASLIEIWGGKCALTSLDVSAALRASHIKPWSASSNKERLDPANGILLAATIDALFDRHLITFDDDSRVLTCSTLSPSTLEICGLKQGMKVNLQASNHQYLQWHRREFERVSGSGRLL